MRTLGLHTVDLRRVDHLDETAHAGTGECRPSGSWPRGSLTGTVSDVSTAITMNLLPSPSAVERRHVALHAGGQNLLIGELSTIGRLEFYLCRQLLGFEHARVDGRRRDIGDPERAAGKSTEGS